MKWNKKGFDEWRHGWGGGYAWGYACGMSVMWIIWHLQ